MVSRKKRKSVMDGILGGSLFEDFDKVFEEFESGKERESGYYIGVSQTPQGTKVRAKSEKTQM